MIEWGLDAAKRRAERNKRRAIEKGDIGAAKEAMSQIEIVKALQVLSERLQMRYGVGDVSISTSVERVEDLSLAMGELHTRYEDSSVGELLRLQREEVGLTLRQIALSIGCDTSYVSLIETDKRHPNAGIVKAYLEKGLELPTDVDGLPRYTLMRAHLSDVVHQRRL